MPSAPCIAIIGTGDTKADELCFLADNVRAHGGTPLLIDVSVLADPPYLADYDRQAIAAHAETSIAAIIALEDECAAMVEMAHGASALIADLNARGKIHGLLALGGSMGTDLALDVALALPIGMPKMIVSTIAHSPLIPPERIAPDLMMMLWSGGLYGLNPLCRSVLSQASAAITAAARAQLSPISRPLIGITSLGSSCLSYMKLLKAPLEERGYDVAIFHCTGMGGHAFEAVAQAGGFAAVFDFCLQEVTNHAMGTIVSSGPQRLENAGRAGIPQIVAPGAVDLVDLPAWQPLPTRFAGRPYHAHNRLIGSVTTTAEERAIVAQLIAEKLGRSHGLTALLLPLHGLHAWDGAGRALHDASASSSFQVSLRRALPRNVALTEVDAHINDATFAEAALAIFDQWVSNGVIPQGCVG
jgi:uncharacterized protein (UPF0261 family)